MTRIIRFGAAALAVVMALGMTAANAQETKPAPPKPTQVPLKLLLVLSTYQGDKKISSLPYQLWVTANEQRASLRMGVQVPVPNTPGGAGMPPSGFTMRDVGTSIDCRAEIGLEQGTYLIAVTVNDSSVYATVGGQHAPTESVVPNLPTFRNFTSTFTILLRDGQTAQYTTATDPVSGEVLKIDATLNVLK